MERFADIVERDAELLLKVMLDAAGKQRGRATLALHDEFACDGLSCMADELRRPWASRYGLTEVAEWLDGLVEAATRRQSGVEVRIDHREGLEAVASMRNAVKALRTIAGTVTGQNPTP